MLEISDFEELNNIILTANKYGKVDGAIRSGGDQYDTNFFKSIRLQMGDTTITQPYRQHVWTYSCVKAIATAMSSVPFVIVKEENAANNRMKFTRLQSELRAMPSHNRMRVTIDKVRARGFEIVESGELYNTFAMVNPLLTRSQLWQATVISMNLYGDCFWVLDDGSGNPISQRNAWPKEIYPFAPTGWKPVIQNGILSGWRRTWVDKESHEQSKTYELWQLLHFYEYNPYSLIDGMGAYEVVKDAASQDKKASAYNQALLDNGGEPGGILKVQGNPNKQTRDQILQAWEDRHKGPNKGGRTAILMGGAEYDRNPTTPRDMEYQESRKWNRDETFAAFRVPKMLASIYEDINYATAQVQLKQFWENVCIPMMVYFEDLINGKLFANAQAASGYYGMFDLSTVSALQGDLDIRSQTAQRFNQIGIPTADIIDWMDLGVEKRDWQKQWWVPFSMVPVSDTGGYEAPQAPGADQESTGSKVSRAIGILQREIDKKKLVDMWWKLLAPIEKNYQKKLKTYWWDLRKVQLDAWFSATKSIRSLPTPSELNSILFNSQEWQTKMSDMSAPFYYQTSEIVIEEVAEELGTAKWDVNDPRVVAIMESKKLKVKTVPVRFRDTLKESIMEGMQENETVAEISQRIRDLFNIASADTSSMRVARTETAQCGNAVRNANFKFEGVAKHEWSTAGDANVREDHKFLGSLPPKSLDHNYMLDLGKSGTLKYPSDPNGPADEVINCRCVELPVL